MEAFLKQLNLEEEFIQRFLDEGIDQESVKLLDPDTLKILIPKIGPRLKFQRALALHVGNESHPSSCVEGTSILVSNDTDGETYSFSVDSELESILNENFSFEPTPLPTTPSTLRKRPESKESSPDLPNSNRSSNLEGLKRKRELLFPEGLENFLKTSIDGRFVLSFRSNLGYRNSLPRKKLCKEIINRFLQIEHVDDVAKHTWMFEEASAEIIKLFPNEQKETYYIPYKKKSATSPKKAPKGRLWCRYHNVRNLLRITEKTSTPTKILFQRDTNGNETSIDNSETNKNYQLLHTVLEPKTRVLELWNATYKFRKTHFRDLTIEEIFDEVPALKTDIGSELIDSDFSEKFPENANNIYLKWPSLSNAILKESEQRKIKAIEYSADVDPSIVALLTLPFLIPPVTLKRAKAFNWRPSRTEVQESFFFHVEKIEDLPEIIQRRQQKLSWAHTTLQPFGLIVGPLNLVPEYHVYVGEVVYKFESLFRALDILYKSFHALNIKYPLESQHIWYFIESIIFDIKCRNSAASSLISDLKPHLYT